MKKFSGDSMEREETDDMEEIRLAVDCISSHFREPLEAKCVNLANIQDELEEIVTYARKYKRRH